ncbi:MAG: TonB-dependent receptor, partial [Gammaproteobacteria bacterium]
GLSADGTTGLDGGFPFGDVLNYKQRLQQRALRAELEYPLIENWTTLVRLARSEDVATSTDPATASNNTNIRTRIDQWSWENRLDFGEWNALVGLEQHRDSGKNYRAGLDKSVTQTAAFAELGAHLGIFDATAAIRQDRNSTVQNKTTYRLGLALRPINGLKLFANYGTGFKAPTINALFYPGSGNPDLKPESSKGWDAGVRWNSTTRWGDVSLGATYFYQDITNLIEWIPPAGGGWMWFPINASPIIKGWELEGRLSLEHAYLRANWTVQSAKEKSYGYPLARRAKEKGGIGIGVDSGIWGVDAYLAIVGPRFSTPNYTDPMAGYTKLDARAWVEVMEHVRLTARVENAENRHYEEVKGYGVMPRVWYLGVEGRY